MGNRSVIHKSRRGEAILSNLRSSRRRVTGTIASIESLDRRNSRESLFLSFSLDPGIRERRRANSRAWGGRLLRSPDRSRKVASRWGGGAAGKRRLRKWNWKRQVGCEKTPPWRGLLAHTVEPLHACAWTNLKRRRARRKTALAARRARSEGLKPRFPIRRSRIRLKCNFERITRTMSRGVPKEIPSHERRGTYKNSARSLSYEVIYIIRLLLSLEMRTNSTSSGAKAASVT